jgi:hypothetical protein
LASACLLIPAPFGANVLSALPRVSRETRARRAAEIDEKGAEDFTKEAIAELERNNPELLQMAHSFAAGSTNYLPAICLAIQIAGHAVSRGAHQAPLTRVDRAVSAASVEC